eukprot:787198-Amphidinium_carterae.1
MKQQSAEEISLPRKIYPRELHDVCKEKCSESSDRNILATPPVMAKQSANAACWAGFFFLKGRHSWPLKRVSDVHLDLEMIHGVRFVPSVELLGLLPDGIQPKRSANRETNSPPAESCTCA